MKKIMLWSAFTVAVSSTVYAEDPAISQPITTPPPVTTPALNTETPPADTKATTAAPSQVINCDYKIPAKTAIEQPTVSTWAKNATTQAFTYNAGTIDTQLSDLKKCFTDQGWQGFNDALQKSGNLEAIKSQQLTVSSMIEGDPSFLESKTNQWKLSMPIQVVYQNTKEKITQDLNVTVLIARKSNGDLGILQMIALPRQNQPATATTGDTTAPANTVTEETPPPAAATP